MSLGRPRRPGIGTLILTVPPIVVGFVDLQANSDWLKVWQWRWYSPESLFQIFVLHKVTTSGMWAGSAGCSTIKRHRLMQLIGLSNLFKDHAEQQEAKEEHVICVDLFFFELRKPRNPVFLSVPMISKVSALTSLQVESVQHGSCSARRSTQPSQT